MADLLECRGLSSKVRKPGSGGWSTIAVATSDAPASARPLEFDRQQTPLRDRLEERTTSERDHPHGHLRALAVIRVDAIAERGSAKNARWALHERTDLLGTGAELSS